MARRGRRAEHRARRGEAAAGARLLHPRRDPARLLRPPRRRALAVAGDLHRHPPAPPARDGTHRAVLGRGRARRVHRRRTAGGDAADDADGPGDRRGEAALAWFSHRPASIVATSAQPGRMFLLWWKALSGSYLALTSASRR